MELSSLFKIVAQNKTPQASAAKGLEIGDTIRVATSISDKYRNPLVVSKYDGTGDLTDPESFAFVGKAQATTFHNNFSMIEGEAAFTVEAV